MKCAAGRVTCAVVSMIETSTVESESGMLSAGGGCADAMLVVLVAVCRLVLSLACLRKEL